MERHITEYGVSAFIAGMYGNFDYMSIRAVIAAKEKYPWVQLLLLLPYHPAERKIEKPKGVDELYYPDGLEKTPRRYAIIKANQKTIAQSDFLISYVVHPGSNAIKPPRICKETGAVGTNSNNEYQARLLIRRMIMEVGMEI